MGDLDQTMRDLLAKASVCAEGPGADYVPAGHHAYGGRDPSGHSWSLEDQMRRRFKGCNTGQDFQRAVDWAEAALDRARKSPESVPESTEQRDRRILEEYEGVLADTVVAKEDMTPRHVWNLRTRNGRRAQDGIVVVDANMGRANPQERAQRARNGQMVHDGWGKVERGS